VTVELIQELTKKLGISEDTAKGAAGLIFKTAKERLGAQDFSKVSASVPECIDLMQCAPKADSTPKTGNILGDIGKVASNIGSGASQLGNLAGTPFGSFLLMTL
jgi:hypothetical protein